VFKSLSAKKLGGVPIVLYFHENQLTYPWSPTDADVHLHRDQHYAFINYSSALSADQVLFNSRYHQDSFLGALPAFLESFPKPRNKDTIAEIAAKSSVLPLGMELQRFDSAKAAAREMPKRAVVLWNHRWEYDKNPEQFFRILGLLQQRGVEFKLIVLGENTRQYPDIFDAAKQQFTNELLHFGYVEDFDEYARLLCLSDLLFVTSHQDFFGGSVVEAMYCNVKPILPKRLAYPEHIPPQYHEAFFYEPVSDRELANHLQRIIFSVDIMRKQQTAQFVESYDWKNMAAKYDDVLQ
jgi:glycosyltransferase involved in cell wall biosynthesis